VNAYGFALDALGDPTRREIFELLRRGPSSVGELAARVPVSRPAVSQHLRVLEEAGLVTHTRHGTRHVYELDSHGVAALRDWVDGFWSDVLARFEQAVEQKGGRS
jgi:DNA-binding transcriptional ArsR family regulator